MPPEEAQLLDHPYGRILNYPNERYYYFIRVDDEAMESVLNQYEGHAGSHTGWVDLIQADWKEDAEHLPAVGCSPHDEGFPEIEGLKNHHVGFQRIPLDEVYPDVWLDKQSGIAWYVRPPQLSHINPPTTMEDHMAYIRKSPTIQKEQVKLKSRQTKSESERSTSQIKISRSKGCIVQ